MSEDVRELNEEELEQAAGGTLHLIYYVYECSDCESTFSSSYYKNNCPIKKISAILYLQQIRVHKNPFTSIGSDCTNRL